MTLWRCQLYKYGTTSFVNLTLDPVVSQTDYVAFYHITWFKDQSQQQEQEQKKLYPNKQNDHGDGLLSESSIMILNVVDVQFALLGVEHTVVCLSKEVN